VCAALLVAGAAGGEVRRVELPLVVPPAFLERLLIEQVFSDPGTTARSVAQADPCSEVVLSQPLLTAQEGRIVVGADADAEAGFTLLGVCRRPFSWAGTLDAALAPRLAPGASAVDFHVTNSWLSDQGGWWSLAAFWDWVKPAVHPRLEALRVDLGPLLGELRRALPMFAARPDDPGVRRFVESLALSSVQVEPRGVVLALAFEVESLAGAPSAPTPEPALRPEELAAFVAMLHEWDAFVTFVIKSAGRESLDPELRAVLLEVLLEARHEIVQALAEPGRDGPDRVRALFQTSWRRLQPALASLTGGGEGWRYLAFVAAGDALAALDQAGPAFGFEISAGGLRRLARTLVPDTPEDPLRFSEEVDPELRETFGFDVELPPLPAGAAEAPAAEVAPEEVAPAPDSAPAEPDPSPEPAPVPPPPDPSIEPAPEPGASLRPLAALAARFARSLWPAAHADPAPLPAQGPESSPLDGFVPRLAELDAYLPQVAELLRDAAAQVFAQGRLEREQRELFEHLVLATAWQESCWRQYVRRQGRAEPLRSSVGALGLMQVNPHVWRGFYSVDGLAHSIRYNARAGGEVLLHYLRDYALARGEHRLGGPDALVRATYAAYHGGPSHLRRYRQPTRWRKALVAVDRAFHAKYLAVASGGELGVRECFPG
jgi:soluble lytic murein transglycosylase-like protein